MSNASSFERVEHSARVSQRAPRRPGDGTALSGCLHIAPCAIAERFYLLADAAPAQPAGDALPISLPPGGER